MRADLKGQNLGGGVNLQWADLRGAYLQETILFAAKLQRANLANANLQKAQLINADLQEGNLRYASVGSSDLQIDLRATQRPQAGFRLHHQEPPVTIIWQLAATAR